MIGNSHSHDGIAIAVNLNHLPANDVVGLFPSPHVLTSGTLELGNVPRPAIIVGSMPCVRFASTVAAQPDVAYVLATADPDSAEGYEDRYDALVVRPLCPEDIRDAGIRALERKRKNHKPRAIVGRSSFGWQGQSVDLSELEARIMRRLVAAQGTVVDKQALAFELWGNYFCDPGRAVDTHIYRIRKRIADVGGVELRTERQRGFRLVLG